MNKSLVTVAKKNSLRERTTLRFKREHIHIWVTPDSVFTNNLPVSLLKKHVRLLAMTIKSA